MAVFFLFGVLIVINNGTLRLIQKALRDFSTGLDIFKLNV